MTKRKTVSVCRGCSKSFPLERRLQTYCSTECSLSSRLIKGADDDCWLWTGPKNNKGYGQLTERQRHRYAHRIAYELYSGHIPAGHVICHHCDTPLCCNPAHLFVGTQADNMADMHKKGRARDRFTCARGADVGGAKLTDDKVFEIRRAYSAGEANQYELARRFEMGQPAIQLITSGRTWKHLL
jgi:hypothetical protein